VEVSHAGYGAQTAELSFRLKRKDIERVHNRDDAQYYEPLDELIKLCNLLHDQHWDQELMPNADAVVQA